MKRFGFRKAATAVFNSKPLQATDKMMNAIVTAPGTISDKIGLTKLANAVKIDLSGKSSRKKKNAELNAKIELTNKKLVEQEAKDIDSAKKFEREKESDSKSSENVAG
ncbi:MAG: hypothetical protein AABY15_02585 [Nanoarchaeota archaeon]